MSALQARLSVTVLALCLFAPAASYALDPVAPSQSSVERERQERQLQDRQAQENRAREAQEVQRRRESEQRARAEAEQRAMQERFERQQLENRARDERLRREAEERAARERADRERAQDEKRRRDDDSPRERDERERRMREGRDERGFERPYAEQRILGGPIVVSPLAPDGPPSGGSCSGGVVTFRGDCTNETFVQLCYGDGPDPRSNQFSLAQGEIHAVSTPPRSTYSIQCDTPPSDACPARSCIN